jgi:hypothetical protein
MQSAGNGGWDDDDDQPSFGTGASKGISMTPKFGHESVVSSQSIKAALGGKSSR